MVLAELERLSQAIGESWSLKDTFKKRFLQGADELAMVRSGLDDTMRDALAVMRNLWHDNESVEDLRMAAYMIALQKVARSYESRAM